jgi:hypothetical protein
MNTKKPILIVFFLLATYIDSAHALAQDSKEGIEARDIIARLPEVIKADKYIIKKTQGKRHLVTFIDNRPTRQQNYYIVTVSEYNGMNMVAHFKFMVDAKKHAICFWDVENDKFIPIALWRKNHYKT